MNDKDTKIEYAIEAEPATYQTGSTKPPKSRLGLILVLLGLVIFLGGIVTALGLTNLQLFRALNAQAEPAANAVQFSAPGHPEATSSTRQTGFGFSGETVSEFWHTYHQLPRGVFVQSVEEGSDASRQGILPGDILVRAGDTPIASVEDLHAFLENADISRPVPVVLHREGKEITVLLQLTPPME